MKIGLYKVNKSRFAVFGTLIIVIIMTLILLTGCESSTKSIPRNYANLPVDANLSINGVSVYFGQDLDEVCGSQYDANWNVEKEISRRSELKNNYEAVYSPVASTHILGELKEYDILALNTDNDKKIDHIRINVNNLTDNVEFKIGDYKVTCDTTIEDIGKALNRDVSDINYAKLLFHVRDVYMQIYYTEDGNLRVSEYVVPSNYPEQYNEVDTSGIYYEKPVYTINSFYPMFSFSPDSYKTYKYECFLNEPSPNYEVDGKSVYYLQDGKRYFELTTNSKNASEDYSTLNIMHFKVQDLPDDKIFRIGTINVSNKTTFDDLKKAFGQEDSVGDDSVKKIKGSIGNNYYYVELLDDGSIDVRCW